MAQHVVVVDHSPAWETMFEAEARAIRDILGDTCIEVHHIGSTSVPGLAAKPIIDIMPVVTDITLADARRAEFERLGYEYLGEFGIPGRRYLRKGGDERTHQVHVFAQSSTHDIGRHLAVRDYLRAHPQVARQYGELKKALAQAHPYDIEAYCDGKDAFVKAMEADALAWAAGRRAGRLHDLP